MATQILIEKDGFYSMGYMDVMNGEINRIDYLEPIGWIDKIKYLLFPPKEFHTIIAKGNKIHGIEAKW